MSPEKNKKAGISLRAIYFWIVIAAVIMSGMLFVSTFRLTGTFESLTEASEKQIVLDKASHELMDASDYLTEKAQRFTIDGDLRFLDEYFTEAFETTRREDAIEKMSGDPKASAALAQLQQAMSDSVKLMDLEYYAMRLVIDAKGYTEYPEILNTVKLSEEDASLSPEDKMRRATETVLGDEYYDQKDRIRSDMRKSLDELDILMQDAEMQVLGKLRNEMIVVRIIIILQILGTIALVFLTVRLGIRPILKAVDRIKEDKPIQEEGAREFRYLAATYNRLTVQLYEENELLKEVSRTDALTGIRNRMALRDDYDSYEGHEVTAMLLDLDGFKMINDTFGHEAGDQALSETGKLLSDTFDKNYCYRYGGDEFLVVVPDISADEFREKLNYIMENRPVLEKDGETHTVGYSAGYVRAFIDEKHYLRDLFAEADQKMYQIKRDKQHAEVVRGKKTYYDEAGIQSAIYSTEEIKSLLDSVTGMYDLARVVDPIECRILEFDGNGQISRKERCYGIWNADQKCVNCTSALACRTGCHQEKEEAFDDQIYHIQSNPIRLKLPDGGAYDAVVELVNIEKEAKNTASANDRAAENRFNRASRYHAQHDILTKVYNPNAFSELSREAIVENPQLRWVMVTSNIMDFRLINTLFGSRRGNEVLVRNAELLRQVAARSKGICGRLGGDQFALLLPKGKFDEEVLINIAKTMKTEFSNGVYTCFIHFGVYETEDTSIPVSLMCDRANTALRTVRDSHQCSVAYFDEDMMKKSLYEQEIISGFEKALKNGEFRMYLQPLAKADKEIVGAEALVRWHREDGSVKMPNDFIETLENAGLIQKLDMYIWECAVKQLSEWKGTNMENLSISVNMSARDLYGIDVYRVLTDLVNHYQVDSSKLRVEITETALLEDPSSGNEVVSNLRKRGFLVEIDDFGKGYSSISLLKEIHADVLKIDMSLLHEIENKARNRMILESIINMAFSLGMEVITEGIETEAQLGALEEMGCGLFQGFYFSRPIPVEQFQEKFL